MTVSAADEARLAGTVLDVPAGALSADTELRVTLGETDLVPASQVAGAVAVWGPAGTTFNPAAELTLPFQLSAGREVSALFVQVQEQDGTRFALRGAALTVDAVAGLVKFKVHGFTSFQPALDLCGAGTDGGACDGADAGNDAGTDGGIDAGHPILINSDSSTLRSAEGTWVACHGGGREERVFSGDTLTFSYFTGTSPASATHPCPGGTLDTSGATGLSGTISVTSATSATMTGGWLDGQRASTTAPAKSSGAGTLAANPVATRLIVAGSLTGTGGPMDVTGVSLALFIDDSTANDEMYRSSSDPTHCPQVGGHEVCLSSVDPLIKVPYAAPAAPLQFQSASGTARAAEGTWTLCSTDVTDTKEVYTFTGWTMTIATFQYTSVNASCSAGETPNQNGTLTAGPAFLDFSVVGWTDNTALTTAPMRADGTGSLPARPLATEFLFTGTYGGRSFIDLPFGGFVDDTGSVQRLYRLHEKPNAQCLSGVRGQCLFVDALTKQ